MAAYKATPQNGRFAVRVETDDLLPLVKDPTMLAELQGLIDKHMVLHISPKQLITAEAVGRLGVFLGMEPQAPARQPSARPGDGAPAPARRQPISADYPFIGDFSTPARERVEEERIPSYIETLHYDGISSYSVQATFNTPLTTPNLWSDMRAAYAELPRDLKKIVDKHHALHAVVPPPGTALKDFPPLDDKNASRRPLRARHPRTGEPLLYLPKNPASQIEGLPAEEGVEILHELWSLVNTSDARYTALASHNQLFVWDGMGTTHTNPAYPRDKSRQLWFFIIYGKNTEVKPYLEA